MCGRLQMEPGHKYQKSAFWGFIESFGLEFEVMQMKNKCVSKILISTAFSSDNQCPKVPYFGRITCIGVQLNNHFLRCIAVKWG